MKDEESGENCFRTKKSQLNKLNTMWDPKQYPGTKNMLVGGKW